MPASDILSTLITKLEGPLAALVAGNRPVFLRSAPGRLDVLGGLAVEAGGTLAQMALPHRAGVAAQRRDDDRLVIHSEQMDAAGSAARVEIPLTTLYREGRLAPVREIGKRLPKAQAWAAPFVALWYVLQQGPAAQMAAGQSASPGGTTLVIHSKVAIGAAQASSTACVTAALLAYADAWGLQIEPLETALYVHRAEELFAPRAAAHVIDAQTCLHAVDNAPAGTAGSRDGGAGGRVLRYSAQPHQLVGQVKLPRELHVLALDTGVRYSAAGATVEALRLAGSMGLRIIETIYRDLGQRHTPLHGHLANLSPALYRQYFRTLLPRRMRGLDFTRTFGTLPERAGMLEAARVYRVRAAVDHLISEHEHAENFLQAIEELADPARRKQLSPRDRELILRRAGRLVLASHHSYRLRLELSCREADWLVASLMEAGPNQGIYGARISGSGGGGTVVAVLNRSSKATDAFLGVVSAYSQMAGVPLNVQEAGAPGSAGALLTPGQTWQPPR